MDRKRAQIVRSFCFLLLAVGLLLVMASCATRSEPTRPRQLYVFSWEDYFAPDTVDNFRSEFGIKVRVATFGSEEEMLAGLQSQPGRYDVVIASGSMVGTLRQLELLTPLDLERIPNFVNVAQRFRHLTFDPENRHSVPYLWGTTGLAINKKYIPKDTDSWRGLWDEEYKGRLAMLNDPQEVVGAALLVLGYSLNSRDPLHLEAARQKLLEQKPWLMGYLDPISIIERLASGELWAAQLYSGDAFTAAEKNPDIIYIIPREGAGLWVDNLVIPVGAPHKEEAEIFINYILRPEVTGAIVNYLYYASPNQLAGAYIRQEILENPSIYPAPDTLDRLEYYQPLDDETNQRLNRIWAELLSP